MQMPTATRSPLREVGWKARYRAARAVDAALDRWVSYVVLTVGVAGAVTAVAVQWFA